MQLATRLLKKIYRTVVALVLLLIVLSVLLVISITDGTKLTLSDAEGAAVAEIQFFENTNPPKHYYAH